MKFLFIEDVWDLKPSTYHQNKICGIVGYENHKVSLPAMDMEDLKKKAIEYFGNSG